MISSSERSRKRTQAVTSCDSSMPSAGQSKQTPVCTVCSRPDRLRSIARDSERLAGLFKARSPRATVVSEPSTKASGCRRETAAAFRRALCKTIFAGSVVGSSCSVTAATKTRWGIPASRSSSVRRGEAEARMSVSGDDTRPMERNNPHKTTATAVTAFLHLLLPPSP